MRVVGEGLPLTVTLNIENNSLTVTLPKDTDRLSALTGVDFGHVTITCLYIDN